MRGFTIIHIHLDILIRTNTRKGKRTSGEPPSTTTCNHCQDQVNSNKWLFFFFSFSVLHRHVLHLRIQCCTVSWQELWFQGDIHGCIYIVLCLYLLFKEKRTYSLTLGNIDKNVLPDLLKKGVWVCFFLLLIYIVD